MVVQWRRWVNINFGKTCSLRGKNLRSDYRRTRASKAMTEEGAFRDADQLPRCFANPVEQTATSLPK